LPPIESRLNSASEEFAANRQSALAALEGLRALEARRLSASTRAAARFAKRGQMLPRERLGLLLDSAAPFLELCGVAGFGLDQPPETSIPGAGMITGIGYVGGLRAMIAVDDAAIDAGAIQPMTLEKFQRAQAVALREKLPFIHLIESAGANLLKYRVEDFIHGGRNFYNLCRISAAGLPVLGLVHGASTAGGAYMTGLSDYVVMVRSRARAFLAGPPLLRAATGEVAEADALGGAEMHATTSGLAEYLAEDDADGVRILRELCASLSWDRELDALPEGEAPLFPAEELLGAMPADGKRPVDMREVIARLTDRSEFLEFKPDYGPATVCGHGRVFGFAVGFVTNNGPIDVAGSGKAAHFIQACSQNGTPLIFLQNTTGYMVGLDAERAGIIKYGSRMVQAVATADVPKITIQCGGSFGAGNYGMCGRGFEPNFLFSWPTARTGVMGAEQAARTMAIVAEDGAAAQGRELDRVALAATEARIIETFEGQTSAVYTSARLLDDGVIDPRDTRRVLGLTLAVCLSALERRVRPTSFGVGRG
jgi:geranyl-CoA carboxylase beta subunit